MLLKNHECWEHPQAQRLTEKLGPKLYICNIHVTHMTSYIPTSLCLIEHWVSDAAELQPVKALAASSKLRVGWRYQPGRTGEVTARLSQQLSKMPRNFEVKNILSYRVREAYNHRAMLDPSKALILNLRITNPQIHLAESDPRSCTTPNPDRAGRRSYTIIYHHIEYDLNWLTL